MLTQISSKLKGILSWAFLLTISVVFIFWGSVGLRLATKNYIDVNGEKVYPQEINAFKQVYPNADLVQITLGIQELNKIGFNLSDEQLDKITQNLPLFQVDGQFSAELYQRYLRQNLPQLEAIRKGAYFNNLVQQMVFSMQQAQAIFPLATERYYQLLDQKRNVSILTVEQQNFTKDIKASKEELEKYYDSNKDLYIDPAKVKLEYIKLDYPSIVKQVKLSKEDIEKYYDTYKEQFIKPGKKKIAQIVIDMSDDKSKNKLDNVLAELDAGKDFGELAEKYSDDKLTASEKGDAGWFQYGDLGDVELDTALLKLNKDKVISDVVTYDNKWFILKLLDQKPEEALSLKASEQNIKTKLSEQRANTIYADLKEQLERKSFEIADSLDMVAEDLNLKTNVSEWINNNGLINANLRANLDNELLVNPKVIAAAFSEDVLDGRNNSTLLELNNETALVLRINDYTPERVKDFSEVEKQVKQAVIELKAKRQAKDLAEQLWQDFVDNSASIKKLESISKTNKSIKFQKPKDISYLDTFWGASDTNNKYELATAFELPKPNKDYPLQAKLLSLDNGDQAILAIDKVELGKYQDTSKEQREQTANQLKYFMMMRDNANFFNRVYQSSKVKSYL